MLSDLEERHIVDVLLAAGEYGCPPKSFCQYLKKHKKWQSGPSQCFSLLKVNFIATAISLLMLDDC